METKPAITPLVGHVFEDTIDGYFPLQESIRQMMERQGLATAIVCLNYAPAMEIPDLAPSDPVPLYVTDGFGCMINHMTLVVRYIGGKVEIEGVGDWKWLDGPLVDTRDFSPLHRLAEPAFIKGVGFRANDTSSPNFAVVSRNGNKDVTCEDVLNALGWPSAHVLFGTFARAVITRDAAVVDASNFELVDLINGKDLDGLELILCRGEDVFEGYNHHLMKKHWLLLS